MTEITNEQKLTAFRYNLWLLSCQYPKDVWGKPEEAIYEKARALTGKSVETTDWSLVSRELKDTHIWERAISLAKTSLGIV